MPRRTDGEKIDELEKTVATMMERLENARDELRSHSEKIGQLKTAFASLQLDLALLQRDFLEYRSRWEHAGNRRWSLIPPLAGGIVGAALTLLVHYLISLFR